MHFDPRSDTSPLSPAQGAGPTSLAWISTAGTADQAHLRAFPHWQTIGGNGELVAFAAEAPHGAARSISALDAERCGWFVWNLVTPELSAAARRSLALGSAALDDEFAHAGVSRAPSILAGAPRVAQSPVQFECRLLACQRLATGPARIADWVLGRVERVHLCPSLLAGEHGPRCPPPALWSRTGEGWLPLGGGH